MTSNTDEYYRKVQEAKALAQRKAEVAAFESEYTKKIEADQEARMQEIKAASAFIRAQEAAKLEGEIVEWIEQQSREHLERLLKNGETSWFVGNKKPNMDIATHISEYLEFLDRCDEEKAAQDQLRKEHGLWGIFG